jgi:hypothetical protein
MMGAHPQTKLLVLKQGVEPWFYSADMHELAVSVATQGWHHMPDLLGAKVVEVPIEGQPHELGEVLTLVENMFEHCGVCQEYVQTLVFHGEEVQEGP